MHILVRKSARLADDPGHGPGHYFLTICVQNRAHLLGRISGGVMRLSPAGRAVDRAIRGIGAAQQSVRLVEHVVMPDHVHLLLQLVDLRSPDLRECVRRFKSSSARRVNAALGRAGGRVWQRAFFDHVIRTAQSIEEKRRYIRDDPREWSRRSAGL